MFRPRFVNSISTNIRKLVASTSIVSSASLAAVPVVRFDAPTSKAAKFQLFRRAFASDTDNKPDGVDRLMQNNKDWREHILAEDPDVCSCNFTLFHSASENFVSRLITIKMIVIFNVIIWMINSFSNVMPKAKRQSICSSVALILASARNVWPVLT